MQQARYDDYRRGQLSLRPMVSPLPCMGIAARVAARW